MNNIILIGMKGCGKSTVGQLLAKKLQMHFIDLDKEVVKLHQKNTDEDLSCREICISRGEKFFRGLETIALKSIMSKRNMVLSCGGGTPLSATNQSMIKSMGTIVFLDTDSKVLCTRLTTDDVQTFLSDDRKSICNKLARIRISIIHESPEEISEIITKKLKDGMINGETKIIGFMGSTYRTSNMYALYNTAFKALNLNFIYVPLVVCDIKNGIEAIRQLGIHAAGVTIPFKVTCIPFLDKLDDNAKRIGSVNVIVNHDGVLTGGNTDGAGTVMALKEKTPIRGKNVVLLGAGGAARAIAFAIKDEGGILTILNRTVQEAQKLALAVECDFGMLNTLDRIIKHADILIQGTSVGMTPNIKESIVPKWLLRKKLIVMDIVNNPKHTQLDKDAAAVGSRIISADRMLFWQAVLKFTLYTGVEAPISAMERALKETE